MTSQGKVYVYATIFFTYYECALLQPKYETNLLFYRWNIDDIFWIWISDPSKPNVWTEFKKDLYNCSKLDWNTVELANTVDFLDLTLWIDLDTCTIKYKTFQKPMNLFLYIPSHSAHTPGLLKSLAYGLNLQTPELIK